MSTAAAALHARTPEVAVRDSAGSTVRTLRLLRSKDDVPDAAARILVSRSVSVLREHRVSVHGARSLSGGAADAHTITGLAGQVLHLHTADGDTALALTDVAGRPLWARNAQGTVVTAVYEAADAPGRPLEVHETPDGGASRIRARYSYGDASAADRNLAGSMQVHHDNAGRTEVIAAGLTGHPLWVERRLLPADAPAADWRQDASPMLEAALITVGQFDATGSPLSTTDAAGVTTESRYARNGAMARAWVRWVGDAGGTSTLDHVVHAADGRVLSQTGGGGVTQAWKYEPRTLRLQRHTVARPSGHPHGALVLADVQYGYDPAGRIVSLNDMAVATAWRRNRTVDGERRYTYDSLYRLASASGRERLGGDTLHAERTAGEWYPYEESYTYDDGDNLTRVEHRGESAWTRNIAVSSRSNRALAARTGRTRHADPHDGFAPGGLQLALADGRSLDWYADGQLAGVSPVQRADAEDDRESYRYADAGSRVRKVRSRRVKEGVEQSVTTYAGGVEWRCRQGPGAGEAPALDVVISEAGGARVIRNRLKGKVVVRFAFADHLGSVSGEVDLQGQLTACEEYYPFGGTAGALDEATEVTDRSRRYSGKELDETGLYYYGWRYYQPDAGRWLSADPGGLVDGVNLYRFCRNDPVSLRDDDGRFAGVDFQTVEIVRQLKWYETWFGGIAPIVKLYHHYKPPPRIKVFRDDGSDGLDSGDEFRRNFIESSDYEIETLAEDGQTEVIADLAFSFERASYRTLELAAINVREADTAFEEAKRSVATNHNVMSLFDFEDDDELAAEVRADRQRDFKRARERVVQERATYDNMRRGLEMGQINRMALGGHLDSKLGEGWVASDDKKTHEKYMMFVLRAPGSTGPVTPGNTIGYSMVRLTRKNTWLHRLFKLVDVSISAVVTNPVTQISPRDYKPTSLRADMQVRNVARFMSHYSVVAVSARYRVRTVDAAAYNPKSATAGISMGAVPRT